MKTVRFEDVHANLAGVFDEVVDDREETVVVCEGREPVVVVPLDDYESLRETMYLMGSAANARRLLDAVERLEGARGVEHELLED